jgi:hypothetical protein
MFPDFPSHPLLLLSPVCDYKSFFYIFLRWCILRWNGVESSPLSVLSQRSSVKNRFTRLCFKLHDQTSWHLEMFHQFSSNKLHNAECRKLNFTSWDEVFSFIYGESWTFGGWFHTTVASPFYNFLSLRQTMSDQTRIGLRRASKI